MRRMRTYCCTPYQSDSIRSRRGVFVGYPTGKKGWKVYDWVTGEIFVSRDVIFHESEFPLQASPPSAQQPSEAEQMLLELPLVIHDPDPPIVLPGQSGFSAVDVGSPDQSSVLQNTSATQSDSAPLGRGQRIKKPSVLLRDFVTHHICPISPSPRFSVGHRRFLGALLAVCEPCSFKEAMTDAGWR
ncbi:unnamed protein product [Cuscuta epithymum]|uniref:Retroviral polymerase SH3-like domain-containing protein n=1 Tax=Cuscuta epithymum TaxID=186058 RepID=A0AAV0ELT5_9ASTE|nr:unnamed protein product [Cuscuta epithymum]